MRDSDGFQNEARMFALRAADHLRATADKLRDTYPDLLQPSDTMEALEILRTGVQSAESCLAHAAHQHALAVLHRERERHDPSD